MQEEELVAEHFGSYLVIELDLMGVGGENLTSLVDSMSERVSMLYLKFGFLGERLKDTKSLELFRRGLNLSATKDRAFLANSLDTLAYLLHKSYDKPIIILIDEYDCPSNSVFQSFKEGEMESGYKLISG